MPAIVLLLIVASVAVEVLTRIPLKPTTVPVPPLEMVIEPILLLEMFVSKKLKL